MSQYHLVVNCDKRQYLHPHCFNDGMNLLEFGCGTAGTMTALAVLLATTNGRGGGDFHGESPLVGSWANDRIAIVGDYWHSTDPAYLHDNPWNGGDGWEDISAAMIELLGTDDDLRPDLDPGGYLHGAHAHKSKAAR